MVTQQHKKKCIHEAQRLAATAVATRDAMKWEEAKQLFRKATGRTLH
jgi:hypothetical protein